MLGTRTSGGTRSGRPPENRSSPPGCVRTPGGVLGQTFIRSNDSLGRPPLHSPSLACPVVPIKTPYSSKTQRLPAVSRQPERAPVRLGLRRNGLVCLRFCLRNTDDRVERLLATVPFELAGRVQGVDVHVLAAKARSHCRTSALDSFGRIGCFNRDNSTRKGGTVQWRTSERIIRANESLTEYLPGRAYTPRGARSNLRRPSAARASSIHLVC